MSKRSAKAKIKVWILDNHPVVVAGLSRMMANHPELKVAATANRMAELPRLANAPPPDVVIMDMNEPGVDGSAVLRRLARHVHPAKVLVFSSQGGRDTVLHMVRGGVGGYLHKKAGEGEILHAVKSVGQGDTYLGQKAAVYLLEEFTRPGGGVSRPEPQASREEGASAEEANAAGEGDVPLGQDVVAYLNKKLADPGVAKPARRRPPVACSPAGKWKS